MLIYKKKKNKHKKLIHVMHQLPIGTFYLAHTELIKYTPPLDDSAA